jgi:hypothetical protein
LVAWIPIFLGKPLMKKQTTNTQCPYLVRNWFVIPSVFCMMWHFKFSTLAWLHIRYWTVHEKNAPLNNSSNINKTYNYFLPQINAPMKFWGLSLWCRNCCFSFCHWRRKYQYHMPLDTEILVPNIHTNVV